MNVQNMYGIEENKPANFIVLNAKSEFEAICSVDYGEEAAYYEPKLYV